MLRRVVAVLLQLSLTSCAAPIGCPAPVIDVARQYLGGLGGPTLDIAEQPSGLDHARALRTVLDGVVAALEAEKALPAKVAQPTRAKTTKAPNPFA